MSLLSDLGLVVKTKLDTKSDKSTTYTKTEVDTAIDNRIQTIVGTAPAALDTLSEIATQLANDESVVSALTTTVAGKQATLVSGTNIKTINGTSVLGSGDIVTTQTTISGNAGTATKLQTARTINGVSFDGSANITIVDSTKEPIIASGTTAQYLRGDKTWATMPTSLPASDVSAWAKASVKPTYAYSEITGTPTIPTALSSFTNDSGFQTATQVNSAIQAVVGAAPAALDTLAEIATQLANDESAVSALTSVVSTKQDSLILADFTTAFDLAK